MQFGGYRSVWLVAMFDLPVDTKPARKAYRLFVKALKRDGFDRMQFSVYVRYCASEENAVVHRKRVASLVPDDGEVRVIQITDKQFGRIEIYCGSRRPATPPGQMDIVEVPGVLTEQEARRKKRYDRKPIVPPDQISFF